MRLGPQVELLQHWAIATITIGILRNTLHLLAADHGCQASACISLSGQPPDDLELLCNSKHAGLSIYCYPWEATLQVQTASFEPNHVAGPRAAGNVRIPLAEVSKPHSCSISSHTDCSWKRLNRHVLFHRADAGMYMATSSAELQQPCPLACRSRCPNLQCRDEVIHWHCFCWLYNHGRSAAHGHGVRP